MNPQEEIKEKFSAKIIEFEERAPRRIYIEVKPEDIPEIAKFAFQDLGCRIVTASGIDTPDAIEILYHFSHDASGRMITLRTLIRDKDNPQIDSIAPIIKGAEWIEREIWEMLGVNFKGHPNLKRLLLADDWPEGKYPLRQDS